MPIQPRGCVRLPDGRVGRVREHVGDALRVRVRRTMSISQQFVLTKTAQVERICCPEGYNRYLTVSLKRMHGRTVVARSCRLLGN